MYQSPWRRRLMPFGLAAALAVLPTHAQAAPGWITPVTITSFIPAEQHLTIVVTGNDNPLGCASGTWLRVRLTDPNYALITSTLLTAFSQGKAVKVWASNCEADGSVHFTGLWVDK